MRVNTRYLNSTRGYCRRLGSLLCLCDVFRALINSLVTKSQLRKFFYLHLALQPKKLTEIFNVLKLVSYMERRKRWVPESESRGVWSHLIWPNNLSQSTKKVWRRPYSPCLYFTRSRQSSLQELVATLQLKTAVFPQQYLSGILYPNLHLKPGWLNLFIAELSPRGTGGDRRLGNRETIPNATLSPQERLLH